MLLLVLVQVNKLTLNVVFYTLDFLIEPVMFCHIR